MLNVVGGVLGWVSVMLFRFWEVMVFRVWLLKCVF